MAGKMEFHHQTQKASDSSIIRGEDFALLKLEARLQELSRRLSSWQANAEVVGPKNRPRSLDPTLDLRLKVDAVRWMLRVAKHTEGPAREQILMTATSSLDQLEKAVDSRFDAA